MKKLIALLVITFGACQAATNSYSNPRNTLITAIARNDFGTVTEVLEEIINMTVEEKQEYLQIADQMVTAAIEWRRSHHWHAEIGKDYLKALGYYLATVVSGAITAGVVEAIAENHRYKIDPSSHALLIISSAGFMGLTGFLGYKTVQKLIAAWIKPSQRLENALRIRDALFHYEVIS